MLIEEKKSNNIINIIRFACMLVFDIKVLPDAQKFAEEN